MKKKWKWYVAVVLLITVFVNQLGYRNLLTAQADPGEETMTSLSTVLPSLSGSIKSADGITTYTVAGNPHYLDESSNGIQLNYSFEVTEEQMPTLLAAGTTKYALEVPSNISWTGDISVPIQVTSEGDTTTIATAYLSDAKPYVQFDATALADFESISSVQFHAGGNLNWGETQEDNRYELQIPYAGTLVFAKSGQDPVTEAGGAIEKGAELDTNTGIITWTLTYAPFYNSQKESAKIRITDTLPSTVEYDSTSFSAPAGITGSYESSTGVLTIGGLPVSTDESAKDEVTITYKTHVKDAVWTNSTETEITNTASLEYDSGELEANWGRVGEEQTASVTIPAYNSENWLLKTGGTAVKEGTDWVIPWTVVVNTHGVSFQSLTLTDTIPKDTVGLLTSAGSVYLANATEDPTATQTLTSGAGYAYNSDTGVLNIDLTSFANGGAKSTGVVVIHYKTAISQSIIESGTPIASTVKNSATLAWTWPAGDGPGVAPTPPTVDKNVSQLASTGLLTKKVLSYDKVNHIITWEVSFNNKGADVSQALLDDTLPVGLTYVANKTEITTPSQGIAFTNITAATKEINEGQKIQFALGDIGTNEVIFTYQTTVDDPNIYAGNVTSKNFTNTIEVNTSGTYVRINGIPTNAVSSKASATATVTSKVISKSAGVYNYADNTITWNFTVNQNQQNSMPGAVITDELPLGLSLVEDSLKIGGAAPTNGESAVQSTNETTGQNTVTISLGDLSNKTVNVSIQTKVDVTNEALNEAFFTDNTVSIANTATLNYTPVDGLAGITYLGTVTNTATKAVKNDVMKKTGTTESENGNVVAVDYEVRINPNKSVILEENQAGDTVTALVPTVIDTLPQGTLLDLESVELYKATVSGTDAGGSEPVFTYNELTDKVELKNTGLFSVNTEDDSNTFTLLLEQQQAYFLKYTVNIVDPISTYTNKIAFKDAGEGQAGAEVNQVSASFSGSSGEAIRASKGSIQVAVVDQDGNPVTVGTEFTLFDKDWNIQVATAQVDANGVLIFNGLNKNNHTYVLMQTSFVTGHDSDFPTDGVEFLITITEKDKQVEVLADIRKGDITFQNVNEAGTGIPGVEYMLYLDEACTQPVTGITNPVVSGADGTVTFEDVRYSTVPYYIKETSAPDVYLSSSATYQVSMLATGFSSAIKNVDSADTNEYQQMVSQQDPDKLGSLEVTIVDGEDTDLVIPDCRFQLLDETGAVAGVFTTDAQGQVLLEDIKWDTPYTIHVTRVPSGYSIPRDRRVSIDSTKPDENTVVIRVAKEVVPDPAPEDPGEPEDPAGPEDPAEPEDPEAPGKPGAPGEPQTPGQQQTPAATETVPKLPKTGSFLDFYTMTLAGVLCMAAGAAVLLKGRRKKAGKKK